jgi:hypothetical protein
MTEIEETPVVENELTVEFATLAQLRREYAEVCGPYFLEERPKREKRLLAELQRRYGGIDASIRGPDARLQAKRFDQLMREWNPIRFTANDIASIAGKASKVEDLPNSDNTVVIYLFDDGKGVAEWRFRVGVRINAVEWSSGRGGTPNEASEPLLTGPVNETELPAPSVGAIWKSYIEADTAQELARARKALLKHLKQRYPNIDARRINDVPNTRAALGLFSECNFVGWPAEDVQLLFGKPKHPREGRLGYSFDWGEGPAVLWFTLENGYVTGIALGILP